jgi:S1-C subfamily serine protease
MKALAFAVLTLVLGCVTTPGARARALEREGADATILIQHISGPHGSGVVVAQNDKRALILTASHCLGGRSPEEFVYEQRSPRYATVQLAPASGARVVKRDLFFDLVLIETKPIWPRVANLVRLEDLSEDVIPFVECYVFGFPVATSRPPHSVHMTFGHISQLSGQEWMRISAPVTFGNSGGGVFVDIRGKLTLVGIVHGMHAGKGQFIYQMGVATSPTRMIEFLKVSE